MKIVTSLMNNRYRGIINAVKNVFEDVTEWNINSVPVFDFFYNQRPDILFCDVKYVNYNFIEATKHLDCKIVMFGDYVPQNFEPDLICADPNISPVMKKQLREHYKVNLVEDYVDAVEDIGGSENPLLKSDIGLVLDKHVSITPKILELLLHISMDYQLKIIGENRISFVNYLGSCNKETELDFLKSVKLVIDIDGNSLLKLGANEIFGLSLVPNKLFYQVINMYNYNQVINDSLFMQHGVKKSKDFVLSCLTSYHRLEDIICRIEMPGEEFYYALNIIKARIEELKS